MRTLELARKQLEREKVLVAKKEMEFKILERLEDIKRLEENIKIQDARAAELEIEIKGAIK